jgi:hypothetical protein
MKTLLDRMDTRPNAYTGAPSFMLLGTEFRTTIVRSIKPAEHYFTFYSDYSVISYIEIFIYKNGLELREVK